MERLRETTPSILVVLLVLPILNNISEGIPIPRSDPEIKIGSNMDFTSDNRVSRGNGTEEDPYIIENLAISTSKTYAISIQNTDRHFVIRNCSLIGNLYNYGICLNNIRNGSIQDCTLDRFLIGLNTDQCINVTIGSCSIKNINWRSVLITECENLSVINTNAVYDRDDESLVESSSHIEVLNCSFPGWFSLNSSAEITISNSEVGTGFLFELQGVGIETIVMGPNNTVQGKDVLFMSSRSGVGITSDEIKDLGEIILVNVSDSILNGENLLMPLLNCDLCSNLTIFRSYFNMSHLVLIDCQRIKIDESDMNNCSLNIKYCQVIEFIRSSIVYSTYMEYQFLGCNRIDFYRTSIKDDTTYNQNILMEQCDDISFRYSNMSNILITMTDGKNITIVKCNITRSTIQFFNIEDCSIDSNDLLRCELRFFSVNDFLISSNIFSDPFFFVNDMAGSFIFNNMFIKGVGYSFKKKIPEWSYPRYNETNIVGGPHIGGNYWAGYHGEDLDYDGFGDTEIPYAAVDMMPLIDMDYTTILARVHTGNARTNDTYSFKFEYFHEYPWAMSDYHLNIRARDNQGIESDILSSTGHLKGSATIVRNVTIPEYATTIWYSMEVEDGYGKMVGSSGDLMVEDILSPSIDFISKSKFRTGERAWIRINVTDNIEIRDINVTIESNEFGNISYPEGIYLYPMETVKVVEFQIDPCCYRIRFHIKVTDINGLYMEKDIVWTEVEDTIKPELEVLSPHDWGRDQEYILRFRATDNHAIDRVRIQMRIEETDLEMGYEKESLNIYIYRINFFPFQPDPTFIIDVWDRDGNHNSVLFEMILGLAEPSELFFLDTDDPMTGRPEEIHLEIRRRDIDVRTFDCSFDNGTKVTLSVPSTTVMVPENAREMSIVLELVDFAGYTQLFESMYFVLDIIGPSIEIDHTRPETGKIMWIQAIYSDNIEVREHRIVFDFGSDPIEVRDDDNSPTVIEVPMDARTMTLTIWADDLRGNTAFRNITVDIIDVISPSIVDIESEAIGGKIRFQVMAKDNWGREELSCNVSSSLWIGDRNMVLKGDVFEYTFDLPEGVKNVSFTVKARDPSGNTADSGVRWVSIPPSGESREKGDNSPYWVLIPAIILVLVLVAILFLAIRRYKTIDVEE